MGLSLNYRICGGPQNKDYSNWGSTSGVLLGGPHNKDYRTWGLYWSPSISDNEYIIPMSSLVNISPCSLRTLHLKPFNMSYSLNSLRGGYIRKYLGDYYRGY